MTDGSLTGYAQSYVARLHSVLDALPLDRVDALGEILFRAYQHDKQVFVVGNGGSAATASHMACDLGKNTIQANVARFRIMSLTDNTPLLSALANDLGYDAVFAEQLMNLIRRGDVLVAITGSGSSANVVEAMRYSRSRGATVIALVGFEGGDAAELADEYILVPSDDYGLVEDVHMILNHVLVGYFREKLRFAT
jgi:D-sedoheptulose 7-phosphate isomerase